MSKDKAPRGFAEDLQNECLKYKLKFKDNYTVPTFAFYEGAMWAHANYIDALEAKLAECVAALEFYASNDNYFGPQLIDDKRYFRLIDEGDCAPVTSKDRLVGGKRAREVLAKVKK